MSDDKKDEAKQTEEDAKVALIDGSVRINIDKEKEAQASLHHTPVTLKHDHERGRFAIEEHERNDAKNPTREDTNVVPVLVRRIDSVEVLPTPFKTTTQLIVFSYISMLFCCFCGAYAASLAFKSKIKRNQGLYMTATKSAERARKCMIAAVVSGLLTTALVLLIVFTMAMDEG